MPPQIAELQRIESAKNLHIDGGDSSAIYGQIVQLQQSEAQKLKEVKPAATLTAVPDKPKPVFKEASHSWMDSAKNILGSIGHGAWDEITHHPLRVIGSGALGFAVGVGATLLAPEVAAVVGVAGISMATVGLIRNVPTWYDSAKVLSHPERYSALSVQQADKNLQNFGAGAVDVTAGMLGGVGGAKFARTEAFASIKDSILGKPPKFELPPLKLGSDQSSIIAKVQGAPTAHFRAEIPQPGTVNVTDIYRGELPKGTGGDFLAQALREHGAIPTDKLVFKGILNQPTLATYQAGGDAANSVLGRTGTQALEALGLKPESYVFQMVRGKLDLIIKIAK